MAKRLLPSVGSRTLRDMAGRLKFVSVPLSDQIDDIEEPELTYKPEPHAFDGAGSTCGMIGVEVSTILNLALKEVPENEMLAKAFKDFMMIGKMLFSEEAAKAKADCMKVARARAATDGVYQASLAAYKTKIGALTFKWNEVNGQLRKLWVESINALDEMIKEDASIAAMNHRDLEFVRIIAQETKDLVILSNDEVEKFERKLLCQVDNAIINTILAKLADKVTLTGRF